MLKTLRQNIDWVLVGALVPVFIVSLFTMHSFGGAEGVLVRQLYWIIGSLAVMFFMASIDIRFLKRTDVLVGAYIISVLLLVGLFFLGSTIRGATSWYQFGAFSFQPSDLVKLVLLLLLAKYFSRRHIEIANLKHILIPGLYMMIPFILVFLQPDFGSAIVIFLIWLGVTLVAGISKRHLIVLLVTLVIAFGSLWLFVFQDYQKARIVSFLNPLEDIQGAGYNAYQSTVAVGSGRILGKGVGYGTQSRLQFLPEYQTDFIFAAYAEEWGFLGSILLFTLFGIIIWRVLRMSKHGASNFEILFGIGVAIYFMSHSIINIGMNIGLLPVTGITLPFMSRGGSHLIAEMAALGILMSMRGYSRRYHREDVNSDHLEV